MAYGSIPAVVRAADEREVDEAIVPIENSLEGTVTFTVDLLIHESNLKIKSEVVVPIHHCLVARPETRVEDVRVVFSHPQAIAQCRGYLTRNLPAAEHVASLSTASAVEDMKRSRHPAVAVSSRRAAQIFDATIVEANIEDTLNNQTRFVALAAEDGRRTGRDRTSICLRLLAGMPREFSTTLLESLRPGG